MNAPNPTMWIASGRTTHIGRRKITGFDRRHPMDASFHETWADAHAALVARLRQAMYRAREDARRASSHAAAAERALHRAEAMQEPAP